MVRIAFATVDWGQVAENDWRLGGAGWARMGLPAKCLKEYGGIETGVFRRWQFNTKTLQFEMVDEAGRVSAGWDIVVFQRWMNAEAPKLFQAAKHSPQVCCQDLDDWYWGLRTTNAAFITSHPHFNPTTRTLDKNYTSNENRNHYWAALGESDLITVSTPYLAQRIKKLGVPTLVLQNMVDTSLFKVREVRDTTENLTVGWVGGIAWRSGDLEILKGVLGPWLEQHNARFYHGGAWPVGPFANDQIGVPAERYFSKPMVAIDEYPSLMEPIDIGIAPLNDNPFNHAKSSIKLREYSAAGIPFIASALPEYLSYGKQWTAKRPTDWLRHLNRLLDPAERRKQQAEQLERVKREDVHVRWADWVQIIDRAVEMRSKRATSMMDLNARVKQEGDKLGIDVDKVLAEEALQNAGVRQESSTHLLMSALGARRK